MKYRVFDVYGVLRVWKTVKLGICSLEKYREELKKAGARISDVLDMITCSEEEIDVDLVVCDIRDLGFAGQARYADICAGAKNLGLEPCHSEVGPTLILQFGHRFQIGTTLHIAMETIVDRNGKPCIFRVSRDYQANYARDPVPGDATYLWLTDIQCWHKSLWGDDDCFVFSRRK